MIATLILVAAAAPAPVAVPFGSLDWVERQVVGIGLNGLVVQEVRLPDIGEAELCNYPGTNKVSPTRDSHSGVALFTWALPEVGEVALPKVTSSFPVYIAGPAGPRCTTEVAAGEAFDAAKKLWRGQKIEWEKRVFTQVIWSEGDDERFKGSCFKTRKSGAGCTLTKMASEVGLNLKLVASSDCIKTVGDEFAPGCTADRIYSGTVKVGKTSFPFTIHAQRPKADTAVQQELRRVEVVTSEPYQLIVFTLSPLYVSEREKTLVLLRVR